MYCAESYNTGIILSSDFFTLQYDYVIDVRVMFHPNIFEHVRIYVGKKVQDYYLWSLN